MYFRKITAPLAGLAFAMFSATAMAGDIDTSEVVAGIDNMESALITVGGALVAVAAVAVAFKWIKGMLFS